MDYYQKIKEFQPDNYQEKQDQAIILDFINQHRQTVLTRANPLAHLTASAFILNEHRDKALMVHHNILDCWAWTGGHADGEADLLAVALGEAEEETGIKDLRALSTKIAALDILPVPGHQKNGQYISAHLHLNLAYLLVAKEDQAIRNKADENSAVAWIPLEDFSLSRFSKNDLYLYKKLIQRATYLT